MFAIVVRLKERNAKVELEHYASDGPYIARLRPTQLENDFWCSVVACRHNCAVMFMIKCRAAKINQTNVGVFDPTNIAILSENNTN
jgi:hypothetical protein